MNQAKKNYSSLLDEIGASSLEPEYKVGITSPRLHILGLVGIIIIGLMLGLAAAQTHSTKTSRTEERIDLIARVKNSEKHHEELESRLAELSKSVTEARDQSLGQGSEASSLRSQLDKLQIAAGSTSVTGSGMVITLDDATNATAARGRVLDIDLRQIVNGLWEAKAEAIAINGQRLTPNTAIRGAGDAITVNYKSLTHPYKIEAIGDAKTLQGKFAATSGGQWVAFLRTNYGVKVGVQGTDNLTLSSAAEIDLRSATAKER
ncbi:MAG: DUF881 domain-containing protein [Propionibacteriaceae bacterium]